MTQHVATAPLSFPTPGVHRPRQSGVLAQRWVPAATGPAHVARGAVRSAGITAQAWSASPSTPVAAHATRSVRAQVWAPAPRRRTSTSSTASSWCSAQTWAPSA
jgi:hypothetical protein